MLFLEDNTPFPEVSRATKEGLLAIGGELTEKRLIEAYKSGIFPWFEVDEPVLWWSPDPRFVLFPENLKVSKSMEKLIKRSAFKITTNKAFKHVMEQCSMVSRKGQAGTWITPKMIIAYNKLHERGLALSVEVWRDTDLVGGLYGVDMGNGVFSGESMFSHESNASKYGFIQFVRQSNYKLIDCQVYTKHLESLGAEYLSRTKFLRYLQG